MPKKNNQEQIPLIEQTKQRSSYSSISSNSTASVSSKHLDSNKPSDAASLFFVQKFKKDFPVNDFSGDLSLNIFRFYD